MLQSPLPLPVLSPEGRRFHIMAKPVGAACNLDCAYCYYLSKEQLGGNGHPLGKGYMTEEVLEAYVRDYIQGNAGPEVIFTWQGGEPTLLGIDFYRKVVALQQKYRQPGKQVENDLQTNGTLLDDEWCRFLKVNRFLVGLSIDGPRDLHDTWRLTKSRKPTFDLVIAAYGLLRRHEIPVNTLTVVNRLNATRPLDVYRFLVGDLKSDRLQFLPCVEPKSFTTTAPQFWPPDQQPVVGSAAAGPGAPDSVVADWSVHPLEYGQFLCRTFDEWHRHDVGRVFVNLFETLVSQHMGHGTQMCVFNEFCGKALAIEQDGSLYSCDHYVYPEYRLGNIRTQNMADLAFSDRQVSFGMAKGTTLPDYCKRCPFLGDCWGECPKNRFVRAPDGQPGLNYLCQGLKRFFSHALPRVDQIVRRASGSPCLNGGACPGRRL